MEFIVLEYYRGLPHQHRLVGGTAISEVGFCGLGSVALNGSALSEAAASASLQAAVLQAAGAINATGGGGWGDIAVTWGAGNSSAAGAANDSLSVPGLLARGLGALQSSPSAALTSSPEYQAAAAAVSVLQTAVKIDTWEPCVLARCRPPPLPTKSQTTPQSWVSRQNPQAPTSFPLIGLLVIYATCARSDGQ